MTETKLSLIESLAELEHEKWIKWSQTIAKLENISPNRLDLWKKLWISYSDLPEDFKEYFRYWAEKTLETLRR